MLLFILLSLIIFLLVVALFFHIRYQQSYWPSLEIRCDKPHFLYGNLNGVTKTISFVDSFQQYYERYKYQGPFVGYHWFVKPAVFLIDPALIKNVLIKDFNKFSDRGMFVNEEDDPLSGQLFNLEGAKWKNMRNKLSPTFTSGKMKYMFATLMRVTEEFIEVFNKEVETSNSIVEVRDLCARFTTDIIGSCAFGIECSSLKDPTVPFRVMGRKALVDQRYGTMGVAFRFGWPKLARRLHMKDTTDEVEKFFLDIVKDTIEYREKHNVKRNDFMDLLLELKNNKVMKSENNENELVSLTFEEVAAQAFVFLVAGFETSSTTMSFALYELAQNQEIQQKAREEVLKVLEKHEQQFSYECLKEMPYLEQVISETLRLHTIVPSLNRLCLEDYAVPGHPKYVIKKDMPVLIPSAAIHRDERYYPNPNNFNPDNFSPEKITERDSILFLPFGDGPRNCIGLRFGKMQMSLGLASLLKHFRFSVCDKTPIPMTYNKKSFLVCSEKGIYLRVDRI